MSIIGVSVRVGGKAAPVTLGMAGPPELLDETVHAAKESWSAKSRAIARPAPPLASRRPAPADRSSHAQAAPWPDFARLSADRLCPARGRGATGAIVIGNWTDRELSFTTPAAGGQSPPIALRSREVCSLAVTGA